MHILGGTKVSTSVGSCTISDDGNEKKNSAQSTGDQ